VMTICSVESRTPRTTFIDREESAKRFGAEVMPNLDLLHRVAYRYTGRRSDAEDLVQETLTKAWAGFASFAAIANFRRSERRPREELSDGLTDTQLGSHGRHTSIGLPSAEDRALSLVLDEAITQALAMLPAVLHDVLWYADVEGLKYREFAARTGQRCLRTRRVE
jgi:RNA polymerase sigma-70 factor, ECF subfamily